MKLHDLNQQHHIVYRERKFSDVLFWTYFDLSEITALLSAHDRLMLRMIANLHRVMKPWDRSLLPTFADVV